MAPDLKEESMLRARSEYLNGIFFQPFAIVWLAALLVPSARVVPSYSGQTGLPCASCHYAPPELNAFGRQFKMEGYTFTTKSQVTDEKKDHNSVLQLLEAFPLSVIFDTSLTTTKS